ncbi:MAG: GMC family oxidoreductase N-terminal domain-containing protein, partial [Methylobacteriaceae bacterium]|nr:GMC family oxidoreductase N-terminal domain-containing protein [Methylobacteriaceae bacterium]
MRRAAFDHVIVGSGPAGAVLAARLSEDSGRRVLLLEAGGGDRRLIVRMPAAVPFAYMSADLGWGYESGPEPHLGGRRIDEKRGRVLGGTSSINAMIFNRGNPRDFDGWAALPGLAEWSFAHCLPYFRAMETFGGGADAWRGGDGPLRIARAPAAHPVYAAFLQAGVQAGHAVAADHNGADQQGLHVAQAYIHRGLRQNAAEAYLRPAWRRANLEVRLHARALRVVFSGKRAIGVDIESRGRRERLEAGEVILAAGAFDSPKLLMLSGVGDGGALARLGIGVVIDNPAVGRHLENHPGVNIQYAAPLEGSVVERLGVVGRARLGLEWLLFGTGLGASNFFEAGAFLKTRPDARWPNMQFEFLPLVRHVENGRLKARPGFQFWMDLSRPESRGQVSLRSADPLAPPLIVFNHLAERADLDDLVDGVKLARRLLAQP